MIDKPEQPDPLDLHLDLLSDQEKSLIYNEKEFLHRILDDHSLAEIILAKCLEEFPERIAKLKQALAAGSSENIHKLAHSIKGTAGNVSALALSAAALKLEECGERQDLTSAPELLRQVEFEFERFRRLVA
jgi:HPt (histidine-containing phosphotransfer) domain-containing protein